MNKIKNLWGSGFKGKVFVGVIGFLVLCCLCSIPVSVFSPSVPTSTPTGMGTVLPMVESGISTESVTEVIPTQTETLQPTETLEPTQTVKPTNTIEFSAIPTISLLSTPVSTQSSLGVSCIPNNPPQTGKVVEVVDGDTVRVLIDGLVYSVRYIGIDTPETTNTVEYYGKEASNKNGELVYGKEVVLYKDVSEKDPYNRLLRYVFVDDVFINYELVNQGYADAAEYPPDTACASLFSGAEMNAQTQLLGMWAPQPTQAVVSGTSAGNLVIVSVNKDGEYVDIQNVGQAPVDLAGWRLVSEKGNQSCGLGGIIQPNEILRIHSQSGQPGYSCGYGKPIWNNSEPDPAVLYNPQGQEVDRY